MALSLVGMSQLNLTVTNNSDSGIGSLREQIETAENTAGIDTIDATAVTDTITLLSALPNITDDVIIKGSGLTINGDSTYRAFFILSGNVTISNMTFYNCVANGENRGSGGAGAGMGGAVYIDNGTIVLQNINFKDNIAKGGDAGLSNSLSSGGSGPFQTGGARGSGASAQGIGGSGGTGQYGSGGGAASYGWTAGGNGGAGGFGAGGGAGAAEAVNGSFSNGGAGGAFGGRGQTFSSGSASGLDGGAGAGLGGAIFARQGNVILRGCTFENNRAILGTSPAAGNGQGKGGAIFNDAATLVFSSNTFSQNTATDAGTTTEDNDSIYGSYTLLPSIPLTIDTTICAGEGFEINGTLYNTTVSGAQFTIPGLTADTVVTLNLTVREAIDLSLSTGISDLTINQTGAEYQWFNCADSLLIQGEDQQTFEPATNGEYAAIITLNGCADTTSCEEFTSTVSISEQNAFSLKLFPNPNNGIFTLTTNETNLTLDITSLEGKVIVSNVRLINFNETVNVSSLESGVYFATVRSNSGLKTIRFVVK